MDAYFTFINNDVTEYKNLNTLFLYLKNFNVLNSFLIYRNFLIDKKLRLLKNKNLKNKNIYIFCCSVFSASTLKLLKKIKVPIKFFIDDNNNLNQKKFENHKVFSSSNFFRRKTNLSKALFIISHQKLKTCFKIKKKLKKNNIPENKIIIFN